VCFGVEGVFRSERARGRTHGAKSSNDAPPRKTTRSAEDDSPATAAANGGFFRETRDFSREGPDPSKKNTRTSTRASPLTVSRFPLLVVTLLAGESGETVRFLLR
jgi:hypothetical protein